LGRIIAITDGVTISATTALTDITPETNVTNGDGMSDGRIRITAAIVTMTTGVPTNGRRIDTAESTTCEGMDITAVGPDRGAILFSEAVIEDNNLK
jgi:hypothetical protein